MYGVLFPRHNCEQLMTAERRRISLSQGWPLIGYPTQSVNPETIINRPSKLYLCIGITLIIDQKDFTNLKGSNKGTWQESEKGMRKQYNILILKTLIKNAITWPESILTLIVIKLKFSQKKVPIVINAMC